MIQAYRALLNNLLLLRIPNRKKTNRGRFCRDDTARRDYIVNCALPRLDNGAFPNDEDDRALFMKHPNDEGGAPLSASEDAFMKGWSKKAHPDPRSREQHTSETRQSILTAAAAAPEIFGREENPSRGSATAYRFLPSTKEGSWDGFPGASGFKGMTLSEVMRTKELSSNMSGKIFIKWITGATGTFNWAPHMSKHCLLYLELQYYANEGRTFYDGSGYITIELSEAVKQAYRSWVDSSSTYTASAPAPTEDDDAALLSVVEARGGTINSHAESEAWVRVQQRARDKADVDADADGVALLIGGDDADFAGGGGGGTYVGVFENTSRSGGFTATIGKDDGQQCKLGIFGTAQEAARAYDRAALKLGKPAVNFPEEHIEDEDGDDDGSGGGIHSLGAAAGSAADEPAAADDAVTKLTKADEAAAQDAWFRECVRKIKRKEWGLSDTSSMPSIMVRPPDPTRVKDFSPSHYLRRPIAFWSPAESHSHLGVRDIPCPNHGYDHASGTVMGGWRRPRRVRGMRGRDYDVAGRDVTCKCCRTENKQLKAKLKVQQ